MGVALTSLVGPERAERQRRMGAALTSLVSPECAERQRSGGGG